MIIRDLSLENLSFLCDTKFTPFNTFLNGYPV
jgi:hypothetical protein